MTYVPTTDSLLAPSTEYPAGPIPDPTFAEALQAMQSAAAFVHDTALALKTATGIERRDLVPAVTLLHEASTLLHHLTQGFSHRAARA
ncbi:MAG TPA: hypothetical protein VHE61_10470 [Opitutaceae bacterium]|nr:hypothetical protein [Opitutaceae bacterium]